MIPSDVTPEEARRMAADALRHGNSDLRKLPSYERLSPTYRELASALDSLATQVEELRADLAIEEHASADLNESQKMLLAQIEQMRAALKEGIDAAEADWQGEYVRLPMDVWTRIALLAALEEKPP